MATSMIALRFLRAAALIVLPSVTCCASAFEPLVIAGDPPLTVQWQPAALPGRRPVIIALHGCGGLYTQRRGDFDDRYVFYAARWNASGWHVAAPDSFGSRSSGSICGQRNNERTIRVVHRRDDVLRTAAWLATRDDVDRARIAIVGWSNGGSTALEALDAVRWTTVKPAAIVSYYPGCSSWQRRALVMAVAPLLLLLGDADEWSPAAPCKELGERYATEQPNAITVRAYANAHHGFDSRAPVRFRSDIPAGAGERGVHVGGNPAAREASLAELDRFLQTHLQAR